MSLQKHSKRFSKQVFDMEKRIEVCEMKVSELKTDFGNPRKITKKKKEELAKSLEALGDFGLVKIDENNNIIGGNQRVAILKELDPDRTVLCKRLIGYTESELRAVNIKDNTHSGEWDEEGLAEWTADLNLDLGIDIGKKNPDERKSKDMELIHYEKYDYVIIACRYETDYNDLIRKLGLEDKKVAITKTRKIKARAVWYENVASQIIEKEGAENKDGSGTEESAW